MNSYKWPASMPYDVINVHDQSYYTDTSENINTVSVPEDPIAFIPFISPSGLGNDNELVYLNSTSIRKYGNPDYYKYGLSLYLANQFISGGGNVLGLRLKAADAMHSHVGLVNNIKIVNEVVVNTVVDSSNNVVYYPYFKKAGDNVTELPRYFEGITYTYAYTDEDGVPQPEAVTIDPEATTGNKVPDELGDGERDQLLSEVYEIRDLNIYDKTTSTLLYELLRKDVVESSIEKVYFNTPETAGDKDKLEAAFNSYVADGATAIPDNLGEFVTEMVPDEDGEGSTATTTYVQLEKDVTYTIPLFMFYALPSGPNSYSSTLTFDDTMENYAVNNNRPERFYKISTYNGNTEIEQKVSFTFSEFVYSAQSMNIEDVILDYCTNIGYIPGKMDVMNKILEMYVTNTSLYTADHNNYNAIDIIFGRSRDGVYNNYRNVNLADASSIALTFQNGSLGSFVSNNKETKDAAIRKAFADAYTGVTTDLIYDEVRYPFRFVFQPCEDYDDGVTIDRTVSDAIMSLVDIRESTQAVMYIPPSNTYSESRSKKERLYSSYDTSKVFFHVESAMIRDPYTYKRIRMPAVYFDAIAIPRTLTSVGYGTPLAGNNFYWNGFITNTMLPRSTNNQEFIDNHNSYINTMVENGNGYAYAVEQITSQKNTSQLSEINNAITLRRMCNLALIAARNNRWSIDLNDDVEIAAYRTTLENSISAELGGAYSSLSITVERESINGAGSNRLHCVLRVSFNSLLKGVTYDIYII